MEQVYVVLKKCHYNDHQEVDAVAFADRKTGREYMKQEAKRLKAATHALPGDNDYYELSFENGYEFIGGQWRDVQTGDEDKR